MYDNYHLFIPKKMLIFLNCIMANNITKEFKFIEILSEKDLFLK